MRLYQFWSERWKEIVVVVAIVAFSLFFRWVGSKQRPYQNDATEVLP